ncbi:hypothetical protein B0H13DRAFT_1587420 [Mycena leptocephala]|nr:hypothetical protein B0H13DRAFT_1587420 [Mycena leptocephala]
MIYVFPCKHDSPTHLAQERSRSKTGSGTCNLNKTAEKCDKERGISATAADSNSVIVFSDAAFRVGIAMQCATSHRPFNFVTDKWYRFQVQLLRPNTHIPDPTTVSRDVKHLYLDLSDRVRDYFVVRDPFNVWSVAN